MGRRQLGRDTWTNRQARHKNIALNCRLEVVKKVIAEERKHELSKQIKERALVTDQMKSTRKVFPYDMDQLDAIHRHREARRHHICMHIVNCYMMQQEKNNMNWNILQERQVLPPAPHRPVDMNEHIRFVKEKFPKTCSFASEHGWRYGHNPAADMYTSYGRNCHNLMCFEARTKTIGQMTGVFPAGQPTRFYKHSGNATQSLPALKGCRTTSTLPTHGVYVPKRRFTTPASVVDDGIYKLRTTSNRRRSSDAGTRPTEDGDEKRSSNVHTIEPKSEERKKWTRRSTFPTV